MGSALILGPTDFGKTRVLCAIGNRVLDYAVKVGWTQPEIMRFAQGVRYISALDVGRARSQGKWEEPEIVRLDMRQDRFEFRGGLRGVGPRRGFLGAALVEQAADALAVDAAHFTGVVIVDAVDHAEE